MPIWFDTLKNEMSEELETLSQPLRRGYNELAGAAQEQRANLMAAIEDKAPALANALRRTDRNFRVIEHGVQQGVVEVAASIASICGDKILNGAWEKITAEKLYEGSAYEWTKNNLDRGLDGLQDVTSLGARKPLAELSETEQNISDVLSVSTQFTLPAMGVVSGVAKGRQIMNTARSAHALHPTQSWARTIFNDAVHFSQHPFRSTHNAVSVANSSKNSAFLGYQLGQETMQLVHP